METSFILKCIADTRLSLTGWNNVHSKMEQLSTLIKSMEAPNLPCLHRVQLQHAVLSSTAEQIS